MTKHGNRAALKMLATAWLIIFLAVAAPVAARADAPAILTKAAGLYTRPSTSSARIGNLGKGEMIVLRATSGAWSKVLYQGRTGYLARKSIRRQSAKLLYAAKDAKLLDDAASSGSAVCEIGGGDAVYAVAAKGGWYKALYKGYTGFMPKSLLGSKKPTVTPKPTATPTPAPEDAYTTQKIKLYKKASASSAAVSIPKGAQLVRYYYNSKTWAKVAYMGRNGYVAAKYLAEEPLPTATPTPKPTVTPKPTPTPKPTATPTPAPEDAYTTQKIKFYKKASASSAAVSIPKGAQLVRYYYNSKTWAKVAYKGKKGYVAAKYLSENPLTATPLPTPSPTPTPKPTPTPSPTPKPTPTPAPTPPPASDGYEQLEPGDSGDAVKKLQTRLKALGWFTGTIGGNYMTRTTQAVKDFQGAAGLEASGIATVATQKKLYASDAPRPETGGDSTAIPATGPVKGMDWWTSDIQQIFYRGRTVVVTDVRTGLSWREVRVGGTNHADCVPLAEQDTAALKAAYGGTWSWNRRPIWVSIDGVRYAASMNGMPHGSDTRDNGYPGHHCIHFTNSRTHGSNRVDPDHQAAIRQALDAQ